MSSRAYRGGRTNGRQTNQHHGGRGHSARGHGNSRATSDRDSSNYKPAININQLYIDGKIINASNFVQFWMGLLHDHGPIIFKSVLDEVKDGNVYLDRYDSTPSDPEELKSFKEQPSYEIYKMIAKEKLSQQNKKCDDRVHAVEFLISKTAPATLALMEAHPLWNCIYTNEKIPENVQKQHKIILSEPVDPEPDNVSTSGRTTRSTSAAATASSHTKGIIVLSPAKNVNLLLFLAIMKSTLLQLQYDSSNTVLTSVFDKSFQLDKDYPVWTREYDQIYLLVKGTTGPYADSVLLEHYLLRISTRHSEVVRAFNSLPNNQKTKEKLTQMVSSEIQRESSRVASMEAAGIIEESTTQMKSFNAKITEKSDSIPTPSRPCYHCGKMHWMKGKYKTECNNERKEEISSTNKNQKECIVCNKKGHNTNECFIVKRAQKSMENSTKEQPDKAKADSKLTSYKSAIKDLQSAGIDIATAAGMFQKEWEAQDKSGKQNFISKSSYMSTKYQNNHKNNNAHNIYLDNCSQIFSITNKSLLRDFSHFHKPISLSGIVGKASIESAGTGIILGEKAYFFPNGDANLFPMAVMQRKLGWTTITNDIDNTVEMTSPCKSFIIFAEPSDSEDPVLMVKTINGKSTRDYFQSFSSYISNANAKETGPLNFLDIISAADLTHNIKNFNDIITSTAFINKARSKQQETIDLYHLLNKPNISTLCRMLELGVITNSNVTAHDVKQFSHLLDSEGDRALATIRKSEDKESHSKLVIKPCEVMYADIFFGDDDDTFLYLFDRGSGMHHLILMKDKSSIEITSGICAVSSHCAANGHQLEMVVSDAENNFTSPKTATSLGNHGIKIESTPAGMKNKIAENGIRYLKERAKSIEASLSYELPRKLKKYLYIEACKCLNRELHGDQAETPNQKFMGIKTDMKNHAIAKFGTIGIFFKYKEQRNKQYPSRGEYGIIVGTIPNSTNKLLVYFVGKDLVLETIDNYRQLAAPLPEWNLGPNPFKSTKATKEEHGNKMKSPFSDTTILNSYALLDEEEEISDSHISSTNDIATNSSSSDPPIDPLASATQASVREGAQSSEESKYNSILSTSETKRESKNKNSKSNYISPTEDTAHEVPSSRYGRAYVKSSKASYYAIPTPKMAFSAGSSFQTFDPGGSSHEELNKSLDKSLQDSDLPFVAAYRTFVESHLTNNPESEEYKSIYEELLQIYTRKVFHSIKLKDIPIEHRSKIIGSLLFLKDKYDANGTFIKVKARLAARGDQEFINIFNESASSPTANFISILTALSFAASTKAKIEISDVPGAFLNAKLQDDNHIYMRLPKECIEIWCKISGQDKSDAISHDGNLYVKLEMALYGIKEASALWFQTIAEFLKSIGYIQCQTDKCIFVKENETGKIILLLHVDDILQISNSDSLLKEVQLKLEQQYGVLSNQSSKLLSYLGMSININYEENYLTIDQTNSINELIKKYNIQNNKNYPSTDNLFKDQSFGEPCDKKEFLSLLMSLMYIANHSRPDILKEVVFLATKVTSPTIRDMKQLLYILEYLKNYTDRHIYFRCNNNNNRLEIYSDASFNIHSNSAGHSGLVIRLFGNTICCKSMKQKLIARSSTEAELIALDEATTYLPFLVNLLSELNIEIDQPVLILQDNKSTIEWASKGRINFKRTKHIDNRYFFIKQFIDNGQAIIQYLPTHLMLADILTKPINGIQFHNLVDLIFNQPIVSN